MKGKPKTKQEQLLATKITKSGGGGTKNQTATASHHEGREVLEGGTRTKQQRLLTMKSMKFMKGSALTPRASFEIGLLFNLFMSFMLNLLERWFACSS